MSDDDFGFNTSVSFETGRMRAEMNELNKVAASFGRTITTAFAEATTGGRKFSDVLRSLALSLSRQALSAALKPVGNLLGNALSQAAGGLTANKNGNVFSNGSVTALARGGVVSSPALFPLRGGTGLVGEAGAEAILPLARGPDGRLGVSGAGAAPVNVIMNISTPDADSFNRSGAQVSANLARAIARGQRNL